jgi:hypothetical protein
MTRVLSASSQVPMLSIPSSVPVPVILLLTAVALAGLDILGAVAAKNWATQQSAGWFLSGVAVFAVLFWTYGSALQYAELSIVTMGWIVMLQVGLLVLDRVKYDVTISSGQVLAVGAILLLQGYLVLAPSLGQPTGPG